MSMATSLVQKAAAVLQVLCLISGQGDTTGVRSGAGSTGPRLPGYMQLH
jgi:hypothetical protein